MLNLDWLNSKNFSGQPRELNFVPHQLYRRKFLRIVEIQVYQQKKKKAKTKNEK